MKVSGSAFTNGGLIPKEYTCDGRNVNPELLISEVDPRAKYLAVIMDDPDAPAGLFTHWVVFDLPVKNSIGEDEVGGLSGKNSFGDTGYGGPCPGSGEHRYFFRILALNTKLGLQQGVSRHEVERAMGGKVVNQVELMGRYSRR